MEFIQNLLDNSNIPFLTAFLLGLLTALSPCPLATNITAIGYISKDIENKKKIFRNGLLYTLGRVIAYTILAWILILILKEGASIFKIQKSISKYGEMILPPLLILIGLFMLFGKYLNLPKIGLNKRGSNVKSKGIWNVLVLGIVFALAFCPTSAVFYFGMLIPMSVADPMGYFLPIVFAIATGLPVIIVAWILAFSVQSIGKFYNRMTSFEKWMRIIIGIIFLIVGIYYIIIFYI